MHGKYPFPEATATTQVLASGLGKDSANAGQAKTLIFASLIGGIYDYVVGKYPEHNGYIVGTDSR